MEQAAFGTVVGAVSLAVGYAFHQWSQFRSKELSYLQHVPQFTNMAQLREHLSKCPEQRAEVLVEGVVAKLGDHALKSDKSGVEGAARLLTTTTYKKVYHAQSDKWNETSSTIENVRISVPFILKDNKGSTVTIEGVHNAGGFRQIVQRVWQERIAPESKSIGDFATSATLKEIPNGSHIREYLLLFSTGLGAYGTATLQGRSMLSSGSVLVNPIEVSSSIEGLIARNEFIVRTLKFFSVVFLVGGGGVLLLSLAPLLMQALGYDERSHSNQEA